MYSMYVNFTIFLSPNCSIIIILYSLFRGANRYSRSLAPNGEGNFRVFRGRFGPWTLTGLKIYQCHGTGGTGQFGALDYIITYPNYCLLDNLDNLPPLWIMYKQWRSKSDLRFSLSFILCCDMSPISNFLSCN